MFFHLYKLFLVSYHIHTQNEFYFFNSIIIVVVKNKIVKYFVIPQDKYY